MTKYIHIGFPKNFSTSLQRDYFSKHPEIDHLGIGLGSNLGYFDSTVEKTFEVYLKSCKSYKYTEIESYLVNHFNSLFEQKKSSKAIGVSAEHLSFNFTYDGLGGKEKAERLYSIFGKDTKIIMIIRNQFDLIKSLYRECVRVGFAYDFSDFIKYLYKYQDRNFVYDFRYDYVFDNYAKLFGSENIGMFFFEDYRDESGEITIQNKQVKLFVELNSFLDINTYEMEFGHYNEAIPSDKILAKSQLNKIQYHDLGNHMYEIAEKHRIVKYLEEDLNYFENEEDTYSDVIIKRDLIDKAVSSEVSSAIDYDAEEKWVSYFKRFYEEGNKRLETLIEKSVPRIYFDQKF